MIASGSFAGFSPLASDFVCQNLRHVMKDECMHERSVAAVQAELQYISHQAARDAGAHSSGSVSRVSLISCSSSGPSAPEQQDWIL